MIFALFTVDGQMYNIFQEVHIQQTKLQEAPARMTSNAQEPFAMVTETPTWTKQQAQRAYVLATLGTLVTLVTCAMMLHILGTQCVA
jgi:hypothetical protein